MVSIQALTSCPACASVRLGERLFLEHLPVILNYRFPTMESARNVLRRDLELRECNDCGLVFNAILDAAAIPYDEHYENRQNFSPGFMSMLNGTAALLTHRYLSPDAAVIEVGCGKGDFLKLLCNRSQTNGIGYDTSCEETGLVSNDRVCFHQRYITPADVISKVSLVVCRHVVEHVPQIGDFFQLLHDVAVNGGGSVVYIETPALEWIVEHAAFWDVFYEHCNYFSMRTLRLIAENAGFEVLDHRLIFEDQYQSLELRPRSAQNQPQPCPAHTADSSPLARLAGCLTSSLNDVANRLAKAGSKNGWAVWGAGAKGVSLANVMRDHPPSFIIDSNPAKQGMFLPGSGIPVIAPNDSKVGSVPVILVANSNYLSEIRSSLAQTGCTAQLLSL
jgi:SAM-dependent methyltransferase